VPHRLMGVGTSGAILFRQVGGSIGVALFGAIFTNRLHANLPPGLPVPKEVSPELVDRLPPEVHDIYVAAFAQALQPVFLVAAAIGVAAFVLAWLLKDVPLRKSTGAGETAGETFGLEEPAPTGAR
jgi:hypothetical protein